MVFKKRYFVIPLFLLLASVVFCTSCRTPRPAKVEQEPRAEMAKVTILDKKDQRMHRKIHVVRQRARRLDNGILEVQIAFENAAKYDIWADIQVVFKDSQGFEIEKTNWQPFLFTKGAVTDFRANSMNSKAEDYQVFLRNLK